jgi:hypothetical protein
MGDNYPPPIAGASTSIARSAKLAYSRRQTLCWLGRVSVIALAARSQAMAQIAGEESRVPASESPASAGASNPPLTCGSVEDDTLRDTFEYVDVSTYGAAEDCRNCEFWMPVEAGASCGGCTLIAGPISPYGWCTAWAPASGVTAPAASDGQAPAPNVAPNY